MPVVIVADRVLSHLLIYLLAQKSLRFLAFTQRNSHKQVAPIAGLIIPDSRGYLFIASSNYYDSI